MDPARQMNNTSLYSPSTPHPSRTSDKSPARDHDMHDLFTRHQTLDQIKLLSFDAFIDLFWERTAARMGHYVAVAKHFLKVSCNFTYNSKMKKFSVREDKWSQRDVGTNYVKFASLPSPKLMSTKASYSSLIPTSHFSSKDCFPSKLGCWNIETPGTEGHHQTPTVRRRLILSPVLFVVLSRHSSHWSWNQPFIRLEQIICRAEISKGTLTMKFPAPSQPICLNTTNASWRCCRP